MPRLPRFLRKLLIVVGDGMADPATDRVGNPSALEAANTPVLDELAHGGSCGTLQTIPAGMPAGSDVAHLSILGYDAREVHPGRGPLESVAHGIDLGPHEHAYRGNLVRLCDERLVDPAVVDVGEKVSAEIWGVVAAEAVRHGARVEAMSGYHCIVVFGAPPGAAPLELPMPVDLLNRRVTQLLPSDESPVGRFLRGVRHALSALSGARLPNALWLWGGGGRIEALSVPRAGDAAVVSRVAVVRGVGAMIGADVLPADAGAGARGLASSSLEALGGHALVLVHVQDPDDAAHRRDAELRLRAVERFDRELVRPLRGAVAGREDVRLVVLSDHTTSAVSGRHGRDPVPFVAWPRVAARCGASSFTESECEGADWRLEPPGHLAAWRG